MILQGGPALALHIRGDPTQLMAPSDGASSESEPGVAGEAPEGAT